MLVFREGKYVNMSPFPFGSSAGCRMFPEKNLEIFLDFFASAPAMLEQQILDLRMWESSNLTYTNNKLFIPRKSRDILHPPSLQWM